MHTQHHSLKDLFPSWKITRRELAWLWIHLRLEGANTAPLDDPHCDEHMAWWITKHGTAAIIDQAYQSRLPNDAFGWITKKGRQPTWLLRQLKRDIQRLPVCPAGLTDKETLIALFDYWPVNYSAKHKQLALLKMAWVAQQLRDKKLSWFASGLQERQKCQIAWEWYQNNHGALLFEVVEFSKLEDILTFLDDTSFRPAEILYHLEEIKKKYKARQTQANRQGKKQTNLSLSDAARTQLDQLAKRERLSKTEVIELLIQGAHERGLLN